MPLRQAGKTAIAAGIRQMMPFTQGNVWGTNEITPWMGLGRLPEPYLTNLKGMLAAEMVVYIVYSYNTPIAWKLTGGTWIMPEVTYSKTTTNHQNAVRYEIG